MCFPDHNCNTLKRAPTSKPPFTLAGLKRAIPPHCFERSLARSFSFLLADVSAFFFFSFATATLVSILPWQAAYLAWPLHWFVAGTIMAGYWVIAHECGHHGFSNYRIVDDAVGFLIHSSLLVPYFSWKVTHARHHSNTGSAEHDEVFCPKPKSAVGTFDSLTDNPPGRILKVVLSMAVGWPLYLVINVTGRDDYERLASHFDPFSPMFRDSHRLKVIISDLGVLAMTAILYTLGATHGFSWLLCYYLLPFAVFNGWLVTMAFLNHTHPSLPRYASSEWDWLRGALSTVDRDYWVFNHVLHHITDTHVIHHLLPTVPHYHAVEASEAIKPLLGDYFQHDATPILKAFYRETKECIFIEPQGNEGVHWFSDRFHRDSFTLELKTFLLKTTADLSSRAFYIDTGKSLSGKLKVVGALLWDILTTALSFEFYLLVIPGLVLSLTVDIVEVVSPLLEKVLEIVGYYIAPLGSLRFYRETLPVAVTAPFTIRFYRETVKNVFIKIKNILPSVLDYFIMSVNQFSSIVMAFLKVYLFLGEIVKDLVLNMLQIEISINASFSHDTIKKNLGIPVREETLQSFSMRGIRCGSFSRATHSQNRKDYHAH
nr:PREDICTED: delta(12)-oleate desaturase-like [Bemisia tabaci]